MDITPLIPNTSMVIQSYGANGFKISGQRFESTTLVFPQRAEKFECPDFASLNVDQLVNTLRESGTELLLIGCGNSFRPLAQNDPLRTALREIGVGVDTMDTAAACRTYNVLLGDGRNIAALLFTP